MTLHVHSRFSFNKYYSPSRKENFFLENFGKMQCYQNNEFE